MFRPGGEMSDEGDSRQVKVHVWATAKEAWTIFLGNTGTVVRLLTIPGIVFVLTFGALYALGGPVTAGPARQVDLVVFAGLILFWMSMVPAITAWHRFVVCGPDDPENPVVYRLGRREWTYIWVAFLIGVISALVTIPINLATGLLAVAVATSIGGGTIGILAVTTIIILAPTILVFGYLFARFSLALPAAAVLYPMTIFRSWTATAGNGFRIFFAYSITVLPFLVLSHVLSIIGSTGGSAPGIGWVGASVLFDALSTLMAVPVLSLTFIRIVLSRPEASKQPALTS